MSKTEDRIGGKEIHQSFYHDSAGSGRFISRFKASLGLLQGL